MAAVVVEKKAPNVYQQFVSDKVAEFKQDEEHAGKKYMELRALANAAWRVNNPGESKAPRKPSEKKPKAVVEAKAAAPEKKKRAPTAYNIFVSEALAQLKAEWADKPAEDKPVQKDKMIAFKTIIKSNGNTNGNNNDNNEDDKNVEVDDDNDDDDDDDSDDDNTNMVSQMSTLSISRKGETAEEKKMRKAAVKEQRRLKRATKKEVKNLYLNESLRQIKIVSKEQKIDNVSVFKYSM